MIKPIVKCSHIRLFRNNESREKLSCTRMLEKSLFHIIKLVVVTVIIFSLVAMIGCSNINNSNQERSEEQIMEENRLIFRRCLPLLSDGIIDITVGLVQEFDLGRIVEIKVLSGDESGYVINVINDIGEVYYMEIGRRGVDFISRDDIDGEIILNLVY